jgi:hypothetical protein
MMPDITSEAHLIEQEALLKDLKRRLHVQLNPDQRASLADHIRDLQQEIADYKVIWEFGA